MLWVLTVLLGGLVVLIAVLGPSIHRRRKEFQQKLEVHRRRTRKIYGCLKCGKELFGHELRHVCGTCLEDTSFCVHCVKSTNHPHALHLERIDWEVDPSSLNSVRCVSEAFTRAFEIYAPRWCIGWREVTKDKLADNYTWLTYSDVERYAILIGRGLTSLGVPDRSKALLWGAPSRDWYLAQYALFVRQFVSIPMHASVSVEAVAHIITRTKPSVIFVSAHLRTAAELARDLSGFPVGLIVALQDPAEAYALRAPDDPSISSRLVSTLAPMTLVSLKQVTDTGARAPVTRFVPVSDQPDAIVMLLPTSGTSGLPKLTIITEEMLKAQSRPPDFGVPTVMYSFEPLRQSLDVLAKGGRIGVYSGSLARIHEDMKILRPTVFGATPVLWAGLYQAYQAALAEAVESASSPREAELAIQAQWKSKLLLGNRCRLAIIGGAASSLALRNWIFTLLNCVIVDGYGTTETGGLAGSGEVKEGTNLQLIDCPELGYRTSDEPWPRGEIVARTGRMTPGYYGDPEATAERFVTVGGLSFFRTGDVGELVSGKLKVIDRRNAVFKLSQGVFVAPTPLEEIYGRCPQLSSVFVFGLPSMSNVVVAVVMTPNVVTTATPQSILLELRKLGQDARRPAWELPGLVIIDNQVWTPESGLLSSIGKLCRPALRARFIARLPQLVNQPIQSITKATATSQPLPKQEIPKSELSAGLCQVLLAAVPNLSASLLLPSTRLVDLGADSLAFARLAAQLKERFGTQLALPQLVRLPTLLHLQFAVFAGGVGVASLLKDLESSNSTAIDWPTEAALACKQLDGDITYCLARLPNADAVVLTGGTGFFGAFLLAALLAEPVYQMRKVICIARAANNADALNRVRDNLKMYGLVDPAHIARVEAIAGDVGKRQFGLSADAYQVLIGRTVCVVHNAAVVTSALPYASLKHANVDGTAHAIRLAAFTGSPLHHVSTIGLLAGSGVLDERSEVPSVALSLLSGYAQSKWVAERLVLHARKLGLKARIYRAGTLAGHSESGACNMQDTVTRLMLGLRQEKIVALGEDSPLPRSFPLIASDWAAAAVARLSSVALGNPADESTDDSVMHVVSRTPQTLEDLVAAIEAAGTPLARVSGEEFRDRIAAIGEAHPLFAFKTVLSGTGYASAAAGVLPVDKRLRSQLKGMPPACPPFDSAMLVRAIQWAAQRETKT